MATKQNNCSSSLTLKVNGLRLFEDRVFMGVNHTKKFKNIITGICNSVKKYVDYLEKQVNLVKEHHKITIFSECSVEDFTIKKLKVKTSASDVWNERFLNLKNILGKNDFYVPIQICDYLKEGNSRKIFSHTINTPFKKYTLYKIANCNLFHFKLPSKGPYEAVHFIWKQPDT